MSSHRWLTRSVVAASALSLACSAALADVTIGTWENGSTDGWIDWSTQAPLDFTGGKYSNSTTGVTNGTQSLRIDQNGWAQNLAIKLWNGNNQANFFDYTQFAIDFTVPAQSTAGWTELYTLWINAGAGYGFTSQTPAPPTRQFGWGPTGGGAQSATIVFDYSSVFDGIQGGGKDNEIPTSTFVEMILATNGSDAQHGTVFFDNARFTAPAVRVDINGGSSPGTLHPKQRGFRGWNSLPTSGQNGDGAQNSYGTDTASTSFGTGIVASGNVNATLRSRDVVGTSSPSYQAGTAKLNSFDYSVPGRDLDDSGNYTQARDSVYRDGVVAETGIASNGTNHRMEIELTGLDPNTPYKVKFYAYDNVNTRNVAVFTDVTSQPLIFMPTANSGDGNFTPGDGTGGTQYAPSGQFIDGTAAPTFPNANNDFRAIELYATSDGTGNLVFAETTVTGLSGATQTLPVLNGFEIARDQRVWAGGGGFGWNVPANWTGGNIPNAKGQVANFGNSTAPTIDVDAPTTVARLNFSGTGMTLGGTSTLTLDDTTLNSTQSFNVTGRTEINLTASSADQTITAPLLMNKDTQVWVASAGTTLTASNLQPANVVLTKVGAGTLAVNTLRTNSVRALEGTLKVLPNGADVGMAVVNTLAVGSSGLIDLSDNDLVVNNMPFTTVKSLVLAGFGNTPGGIGSSTSDGSQILALFDNALVGAGDWQGVPIGANAIVGKYTYFGDVNFDGQVTGDDYTIVDSNLNTTPPVGFEWLSGDANLDGIVTGDDYTTIDSNLGLGSGNPLSSASLSPVPEPTALGLVLSLALFGVPRRRRYPNQ